MNAKELFGHWAEVRDGLLQSLDQLTDEQLDFAPREGLWSLGTVARHIASAEEGWFRHVVTRELDGWPNYTTEDYPTVEAVKALLTDVHTRTDVHLATIDAADIDQIIALPWGSSSPALDHLARAGARNPPSRRDIPYAWAFGHKSAGYLNAAEP